MPLSITVCEIYSRSILVENCYPLAFGAPVRDEAVRVTQQPWVTKN